jgi:hypothetical protein
MKKLLFLLILLQAHFSNAQQTFQKTYGFSGGEFANHGIETRDGGFIMVGRRENTQADIYVVKTDSAGTLQWSNLYSTGNNEDGLHIIQTGDGGYLITGSYENYPVSSGSLSQELFLMKLTPAGNLSWSRVYGVSSTNPYFEAGYNVLQTPDKGFLVSGYSSYYKNMYIIKTDSLGIQQSSHVFNAFNSGAMQQTPDGNYILMGSVRYSPLSLLAVYLTKITANGTPLWQKFIKYSGGDFYPKSFQQTTDEGFIITGYINVNSTNIYAPCLIKTDSSVTPQWAKSYNLSSNDAEATYVLQTPDGGYALGVNNYNGRSFYVIKTATDGSLQSTNLYGDTSSIYSSANVYNIAQTHDKGFAMFATSTGYVGNQSTYSFYLIKTDSLLNSGCSQYSISALTNTLSVSNLTQTITSTVAGADSIMNFAQSPNGTQNVICYQASGINKILQQNDEVTIYPNPANSQIFIDANTADKLNIIIYDVNGKQVLNTTIANKSSIDISTLANGVYTLTLSSANFSENKKLVIIK